MTRVLLPAILLAFGVGSSVSPPNVQAQASPGTGQGATQTAAVLIGQVVDAETGEPIPDALVTLAGRPAPAAARGRGAARRGGGNLIDLMAARGGRGSAERVAADQEGRFVFRDLPAARYTLRAEAAGYLQGAPTVTGRGGGPATVTIADGDTSARVTVRLSREAVITGLVVDEANEPVIGARVVAYRLTLTSLGDPTYVQAETGRTDDRGEYRMFGLTPGAYVVAVPQSHDTSSAAGTDALLQSLLSGQIPAGGMGGLGRGGSPMNPNAIRVGDYRLSSNNVQPLQASADAPIRAYRTVYHPGALSPTGASAITLRSGEERTGVDFVLTPVVTGRVTGTVIGPGGPAANVPVRLVSTDAPQMATLPDVASGSAGPDGRFMLLAVPPGQYRVIAEREALNMGEMPEELASNPMIKLAMSMRAAGAGPPVYGEAIATVSGGDVVDVAVTGSAGVTVTGDVRFEGASPSADELQRVRMTLRRLGGGTSGGQQIRVDGEGRFKVEGVFPGHYIASGLTAISGGPFLIREVRAGGRESSTTGVLVGSDDLTMTVTFTNRVGTVSGSIRRETRQSGADVSRVLTAVVVPADYATWTSLEGASELIRLAPVGEDGTFRSTPVLSGDYLVAVVDEAALDLSRGVAALQALAQQATRVTVGVGEANVGVVDVARGR